MKRTLDSFVTTTSQSKKQKLDPSPSSKSASTHPTYPFPVPQLPPALSDLLQFSPAVEGKTINDQPDLDLLYFQPYIPTEAAPDLFTFLRSNLFFYRVRYTIKRGPTETLINTPRFTTVFGVDETSRFDGADLIDRTSSKSIPKDRYQCRPRPLPGCLEELRRLTEAATNEKYNFCLVNYYATGNDSISYHSDDERFLGPNPAIASFSLGARRDFLMKHKPPPNNTSAAKESKPLKLALGSGDMVLMRGTTQAQWLHAIPKRTGKSMREVSAGRINITFRRAMVRGGTENYYRYNVGEGGAYRWDESRGEMMPFS